MPSLYENLAKDLNVATREIWRCVQFAKKCHTVTQLEHKSWRYVINNFLPDNHRPKEDNKLEQVKGQYEVIVIDPPWPYGTEYDSQTRRVASPYKEVSFEELKNFNIPASENSVLWLWTTHKFLPISFDLLRDWGFEYKLTLVWNKEKLGMGAWLRCQAEFCLLGIKGKPEWDLVNERDIINSKRREHSRKPNEFYNMVEKLSSGRKIDIFGREKRDGWDSYGNEEKF